MTVRSQNGLDTEQGLDKDMKKIAILGSTGSIGTQTLEVVRANPELRVVALAAGSNVKKMEEQIREFAPAVAGMWTEEAAADLRARVVDRSVRIVSGMEGLLEIAALQESQVLVTAIVGMIGIRPTIAAIEAGKDIALANKETLVTAGHIIMPLAQKCGVAILPVDSEHSAIFQSLNGEPKNRVEKILLTASGGPFRGRKKEQLRQIQVEDALKHPNWFMGHKVTIDSSTLVNKGLEVMEARWLFDVGLDRIQVVVHPQSIIHSAVEYVDGAVIAQLGTPDMKLPIQYALFYPDRRPMQGKRVDLFELGQLTFEKPDMETFTGLKLAYEAARTGGTMPTVFNAANEMAVRLFLERKIGYPDIPELIGESMARHKVLENPDVEQILETEATVYEWIREKISER
ncbi:MAG: 1-deoxy-D-xylulose-5-phosphate reductoisomerase [Candidatus Gastranaerophilales bacterium]|nr:1-deoxy-D-xylulose-5-phosphate reductoisomerase [Candidatus Gastranaerophilales bacterium]